jgi:hypothetical protein
LLENRRGERREEGGGRREERGKRRECWMNYFFKCVFLFVVCGYG